MVATDDRRSATIAASNDRNIDLKVIPIPSSRTSAVQDIFNLAAQKSGFEFLVIKSKFNSSSN
ncbi:unnamed protein product [Camellia sinensis]